jgi:ATPase family associated with various cellular activities (AAA)
MTANLLNRLFRTIDADTNTNLYKVAMSIVQDEEKRGHTKVAAQLRSILQENSKRGESQLVLKPIKSNIIDMPLDRRYRLPLATHLEHDMLRHFMILSPSLDSKITRIEKEYLASDRLAHHGLKPRKKILLFGASGCGKSMTAEKLAWDLGLPFYKVRFDTIISSYLGESASNLQLLFERMKDYPCVLLLDEFDIIAKQRESKSNDVGEMHRIVNILLGLLEEYDGQGILIATTNLEGALDKALYRRFDDIIELPKPTENEIFEILKMALSSIKMDKSLNLKTYAKKLIGASFAIANKVGTDASKMAVIQNRTVVSSQDMDLSLEENLILKL